MVNMTSISIWTEADRLCERCAAQVARADDWLCQGCRSGIEKYWQNLTSTNSYVYGAVPPSHQSTDVSQKVTKLF